MLLSTTLLIPGVLLFYFAGRSTLSNVSTFHRLQFRKLLMRSVGFGCLLGGYGLAAWQLGLGAGLFTGSVILMSFTSFLTVLFPLRLRH